MGNTFVTGETFFVFIRLRRNTLQLAAGMNGKVNRAEAHQSEGGLISLYNFTLEWLRRNSALIPRSLLRGASFLCSCESVILYIFTLDTQLPFPGDPPYP